MTRAALWSAWLVGGLLLVGCGEHNGPAGSSAATSAEAPAVPGTRSAAETVNTADVVDALFLGSGPLIPRDGVTACPQSGTWSGFPRNTSVRVRVSTTVSEAARDAIQQALDRVGPATGGVLGARFELTTEPDPRPGPGEVTVTSVASPRREGCPSDRGCVVAAFAGRGILQSGRAVEPGGQLPSEYVRDAVGRGLLGLCHIDARRIGGARNSLMSGGPGVRPGDSASGLTGLDTAAIRAVYASALSPGASRSTFLPLGLVNLQAGERRRGS